MNRTLTHPAEPRRRIHPFRLAWAKKKGSLGEAREAIMQAADWSETTFYDKVSGDKRLTEAEAEAVSNALGIPINEIDSYQHGFA